MGLRGSHFLVEIFRARAVGGTLPWLFVSPAMFLGLTSKGEARQVCRLAILS